MNSVAIKWKVKARSGVSKVRFVVVAAYLLDVVPLFPAPAYPERFRRISRTERDADAQPNVVIQKRKHVHRVTTVSRWESSKPNYNYNAAGA